jgi:CheY-like chemotaxis protein
VLIADDHVDAAIGLAEWLETMGYEVYTAYDGIDALDTARRVRPDAMLLDITMPGLDGDEVCRRLRQEPWAREVMIAAVTGYSGAEDRRRSREAGFDHHFVKPVDPRKIRDLLQSL